MKTDNISDILRCEIARTGNYGYYFDADSGKDTDDGGAAPLEAPFKEPAAKPVERGGRG